MAINFLNAEGSLVSVVYVGLVLKINKSVDYRIMSDVWGSADQAVVWDKDNNCPKTVTIRACDYTWDSDSYAEVDATPEVKAAYRQYLIDKEFAIRKSRLINEANKIVKGCNIEVVKGRKVPKGTKGKVVVMMVRESGWGYRSRPAMKLGIATSDVMIDVVKNGKTFKNHRDMVWVWEYNCERTDAEPVNTDGLMQDVIEMIDHKLNKAS